jgi:SAM-dependent methyltransferase
MTAGPPDSQVFDAAYFEALYREDPDPWRFQTSAYEDAKYTATVQALGGRRYRSALEVGCSIGVLTRRLAPLTQALLAVDVSATALASAQERNADLDNVVFREADLLDAGSDGPFDLIVFSEVLYYLTPPFLLQAADNARRWISPGGDILMVHWLEQTDYPLTGDAAVEGFRDGLGEGFTTVLQTREPKYRLDLLRAPAESA